MTTPAERLALFAAALGPDDAGLPRRLICLWSGPNVPAGWALCDGSHDTPDLSALFLKAKPNAPPLIYIQKT